MSDLRDLRAKVTEITWAWLEAESRATGRDQSEIVRELLHAWALQRDHAATIAQRLLRCEGTEGKGGE